MTEAEEAPEPPISGGSDRSTAFPGFAVTFGDVGLMLLGALGAVLAAIATIAILDLNFAALAGSQRFVFLVLALQSMVAISAVWLFGLRRRAMTWRDIGLRPVPARWLIFAAILAVLSIPAVGFLTAGTQLLLDRPISSPQARLIAPEGFTWSAAIGMTLLGGIVAPFAEELVFRGVLYVLLRRVLGIVGAVLLSALLFGAFHGQIEVFPGTAALGIVLALCYEKSRSLWVPIAFHATYNCINLTILFGLLASEAVA